MQISELLCRAEYIMRATARPPSRRLSPTLPPLSPSPSFPPPHFTLSRAGSRRDVAAVIYPRPPILANCTLQLISDTVRRNKEREREKEGKRKENRQTSNRKLANAAVPLYALRKYLPSQICEKKISLIKKKSISLFRKNDLIYKCIISLM